MAHILIVDDEADFAGLVVFSLNRAGLETEVALTGGASLVAARLRVPSLGLKPSLPAEVLRAGTLVMNVAAHRTTVAGESVELTVLEFRLLHSLMSRPGGVQTRLQLLAEVWGITDEQDTRTVDTHVTRQREKPGVARSLRETVRGVGYRLSDENRLGPST